MNTQSLLSTHRAFLGHLMSQFGVTTLDEEGIGRLKEPYRTWFNWGLGGFERAENTFRLLQRHIRYSPNMRHLDIGCGPGYLSTFFASHGFESVGIDLADLSHANTNKIDFPDKNLEFYNIDCTTDGILEMGTFDVITVDNVMEHAESPSSLVARLKKLVNKNGIAYLIFPNAHSMDLVKCDCHYRLFGITLLDRKDGDVMVRALADRPSYDVNNCFFKYDAANYSAIFEKCGFKSVLCDGNGIADDQADHEYRRSSLLSLDIESVKASFHSELNKLEKRVPEYLFDKLRYLVDLYFIELINDCEIANDTHRDEVARINPVYHKYFSPSFFYVLKHSSCR